MLYLNEPDGTEGVIASLRGADERLQWRTLYNGTAHTFRALDIGDWYDVGAMIDGLNAALKEAGKEERFFLLPTNDQTAAVTFAPKRAFDRVVRTLRIPLESVNV